MIEGNYYIPNTNKPNDGVKKTVMVADKLYVNGMQVFAHQTQIPHQPGLEREQQPAWSNAAHSEPRIATTQRYM